jgi:ribosomal protein S21
MKKTSNVSVKLKHCGNNTERMIRRFIKKCKKERIIDEVRDRRYYKKPSEAKREKQRRAERFRLREERKKQRAIERRNRNNR